MWTFNRNFLLVSLIQLYKLGPLRQISDSMPFHRSMDELFRLILYIYEMNIAYEYARN